MRVELIYTPGCNSYRKTLETLETVIAEERLPIPVEVIAKDDPANRMAASHTIRIDGLDVGELTVTAQGEYCPLYDTERGVSAVPCMDRLREILFQKWKELTEAPLLAFRGS